MTFVRSYFLKPDKTFFTMKIMKTITQLAFLGAMLFAFSTDATAQDDKSKRKSPPMEAVGQIGGVDVKINYSAPSVKGRTIFGELEKWDKMWRLGANEATTIEINKDVLIEGEALSAGKYAMFTIPREEGKWTMVFNSVADQWGTYNYDKSKDVLRVDVATHALDEGQEQLEIFVKEKDGKGYVGFKWDKTKVKFTLAAAPSN